MADSQPKPPLTRLIELVDNLRSTASDFHATSSTSSDERDTRQSDSKLLRREQSEELAKLRDRKLKDLDHQCNLKFKSIEETYANRLATLEKSQQKIESMVESAAKNKIDRAQRSYQDKELMAESLYEGKETHAKQMLRKAEGQFAEVEAILKKLDQILPRRKPLPWNDDLPTIEPAEVLSELRQIQAAHQSNWKDWIIPVVGLGRFLKRRSRAAQDRRSLIHLQEVSMEAIESIREQTESVLGKLSAHRDKQLAGARDKSAPDVAHVEPSKQKYLERIDAQYDEKLKSIKSWREEAIAEFESQANASRKRIHDKYEWSLQQLERDIHEEQENADSEYEKTRARLSMEWNERRLFYTQELNALSELGERSPWDWNMDHWKNWQPTAQGSMLASLGMMQVDISRILEPLQHFPFFNWDGPDSLKLPLLMSLPREASTLIEFTPETRGSAIATSRSLLLKLLAAVPAGKARLTMLDPVGLGESYAGFMHLADVDEAPILRRVYSESRHIDEQLLDITDHMQNVIQTYLRNDYETIEEYNQHAGQIAEPYHFLVIADFPVNISEQSSKRLMSIIRSGTRCGVYTILLRDLRRPLPPGIHESDLHAELTTIRHEQDQWLLRSDKIGPTPIEMTLEPTETTANSILKRVRDASEATHRVEVPFRMIAPPEEELWSASTRDEIRVSLGQSGANRQQYLRLGRGTAQHALVAGKTGSGKSTLMHVLITNLAMWFSPDEIEFYLIDFKKGVEFQIYDQYQLPHAKVIAIESDREFGLSVLQKIDVELKRRGELFRKLGVQDLAGYRDACDDPLPRVLLMIDEFQELFIEDDMITQEATLLMDRLVRQGRAFGMHALLGSQTLDGVYSLARSTMGQMGVRIALQCSEVDSYLILSEDNPHARLLTRPGDAIYNDAGGKLEGNSPFQVVWLNEEDRRTSLDAIARKAEATNLQREPFVFRGHVAAELESCHGLMSDLESPCEDADEPCIWLGDAVAIKPNTCFTLPSVAGANLLILGQNEKAASSLLEASILGLAAQATPHEAPSFIILDGLSQSKGRLAQLAEALPHQTMCPSDHELESTFDALHATLGERLANPRQKHHPLHVVIAGMHGWRGLRRKEDDYSFSAEQGPPKPDAILASVLKEGPSVNIHVLTWIDTINNLTRFLDRTTQREYGNRVLFQMSQMDSSQIIDSTAASRLGENRAVLHREELGSIEKFRPWDKPDMDWLLEQAEKLSR